MSKCLCGCGKETSTCDRNNARLGYVKGEPMRYVHGHGSRCTRKSPYAVARKDGHPKAGQSGFVREHVVVAERALGRLLPDNAEIHHVNGDGRDNRPSNLVVCENHAYHHLLHRRQRALHASGNANWLKCSICGTYDAPDRVRWDERYGTGKHFAGLGCKPKRNRRAA